jgi:lipoprotein-anchoring transpeptidase ErfK/SrfK
MTTIASIGRSTMLALLLGATPLAARAADTIQPEAVQSVEVQSATVQTPSVEGGLDAASTFLAPGQFVWSPDPSAAGPVRIVVSIPLQVAYVFRGPTLIGASSVSTGKAGYDTPVGAFTVLEKAEQHRSNLYEDAPMPFMQRLTWDGVALHAGKVTGQPASHGCVRLPAAFARKLYGETRLGAQVVITDEAPLAADQALALFSVGGALASR